MKRESNRREFLQVTPHGDRCWRDCRWSVVGDGRR